MQNDDSQISLDTMKSWINSNRPQLLKEFFTFLSFPSISADPAYKEPVLQCADWVANYLKEMNFHVEVWPTTGYPVIFGSYMHAGPDKPTLLIYNHYDVQPVDPLEQWINPPFEATLREGQIYARGAQDNKGQCFYVLQALKLVLEKTGSLPLNVKVCIEGEEETGSAGLSHLLSEKKEELKADYLAVVDLSLRDANTPCVTLGIRGIVNMDVEVEANKSDLHSGSHGGIAPNPIHILVKLIDGLRDARGKITIPGFYENVAQPTKEDLAAICFDFDQEDYQKQSGTTPIGGEIDFSPLERCWVRPTLEISGINGGYTGKGVKSVIPAKAYAKISCRLVPNQQPTQIGKLVADYLQSHAPKGVQVKVDVHPGNGNAVRVSPSTHLVKCFSQAFSEVFNAPCKFIFEGATIPVAAELTKTCGGDIILLGLGLISDQIHAPNEHFGLDRIEKGILVIARAMELLGNAS